MRALLGSAFVFASLLSSGTAIAAEEDCKDKLVRVWGTYVNETSTLDGKTVSRTEWSVSACIDPKIAASVQASAQAVRDVVRATSDYSGKAAEIAADATIRATKIVWEAVVPSAAAAPVHDGCRVDANAETPKPIVRKRTAKRTRTRGATQ